MTERGDEDWGGEDGPGETRKQGLLAASLRALARALESEQDSWFLWLPALFAGGVIEPGGFDFGRQAWFARLGGTGYETSKVEPIAGAQPPPWDLAAWGLDRAGRIVGLPLADSRPRARPRHCRIRYCARAGQRAA